NTPAPSRSTLYTYTTLFRSGRLGRAIPMPGVGVKDALETVLVLALADEALQLVLQDIPLVGVLGPVDVGNTIVRNLEAQGRPDRSEEHTSELQSREKLVCRL